jgi:Flp pilus assembly protein TadG
MMAGDGVCLRLQHQLIRTPAMSADKSPAPSRSALARKTRRFLKRFQTRGGNISIIFALALIPLSMLGLAAIDFHRASSVKLQLQDALDSATLAAARSTATTTAGVQTIGDQVLRANLDKFSSTSLSSDTFTLNTDGTVTSTAVVDVKPLIANLFLGSDMMVNASTSVVRQNNKIELALVLDNTGSMSQNNKLTDLQTAANNLIDTLTAAAARSTDPNAVKMSLVPFSQTVRVGSTYKSQTWIDQTGQAPINDQIFTTAAGTQHANRLTLYTQMGVAWAGCVESRQMPYDVQDTAPTVSTPATLFTPYFAPDEPDAQASGKNGNFGTFYNNYLTDKTYSSSNWKIPQGLTNKYTVAPVNGSNASTGYTYGPNAGCQLQPLVRLTTSLTSLKTTINAMTAVGDTNIPMGLMWGWHTISPNAPFGDGVAYGTPKTTKIIILMTDGQNENTSNSNSNASYYSGLGYIWQNRIGISSGTTAQRQTAMDARETLVCNNMKAQGIVIYTVRVETTGAATALQGCASSPDKFYDVSDASDLDAVFQTIAGQIANLHLSA